MDQELYILLKRRNEKAMLKGLFKKTEVTFLRGPSDYSIWRYNSRQKLLNQRKAIELSGKHRPNWCLRHLHDKMFDMRM